MKASDYIAEWLKGKVDYVYGVQGGAVVHLFDSCAKVGLPAIYCHHEQAAGFAAVAHARVRGFGVCIVTTGPGASNALTPLLGAWQDSIPCLFISGQTRVANMSYGTGKRQVGSQEAPICDLVSPITNFSHYITIPKTLGTYLNVAHREATSGRCGPAWLDLPVDVSWASI